LRRRAFIEAEQVPATAIVGLAVAGAFVPDFDRADLVGIAPCVDAFSVSPPGGVAHAAITNADTMIAH
jgi:hypothetical protein